MYNDIYINSYSCNASLVFLNTTPAFILPKRCFISVYKSELASLWESECGTQALLPGTKQLSWSGDHTKPCPWLRVELYPQNKNIQITFRNYSRCSSCFSFSSFKWRRGATPPWGNPLSLYVVLAECIRMLSVAEIKKEKTKNLTASLTS